MATQRDHKFSTFQGRAYPELEPDAFRRRMKMPIATLGFGLVAAVAIAGGALDRFAAGSLTDDLSNVQFLTGDLPHATQIERPVQ